MRRGGRARLKASDSKSDRGPEGPSGGQILSPPQKRRGGPRAPPPESPPRRGCAGKAGARNRRGEVTERPKVRHWKCRARVTPVPWVRIPPSPPFGTYSVAVLDGEVAVPCNPQSATAGLNPLSRLLRVE